MEGKPFIKWVGGKTQILDEIKQRMPKNFNNYIEPFIGGGSLFFNLQNNKKFNSIINDISTELIDCYMAIKLNPEKLMHLLEEHTFNHSLNSKEYYYYIREKDKDNTWINNSIYIKAARLIYLNKACYNGVYRVNRSGYFNVPWNKKEKIKLYEKNNILTLNKILNNKVEILNQDFELVCKKAKKEDFIFFDPPYDLLNKTTFNDYTQIKFNTEEQKRLAKVAHELKEKGCYVMITNHNTELINKLYKDFKKDIIQVKRLVNSNAKNRTGVETIIYSYK